MKKRTDGRVTKQKQTNDQFTPTPTQVTYQTQATNPLNHKFKRKGLCKHRYFRDAATSNTQQTNYFVKALTDSKSTSYAISHVNLVTSQPIASVNQ